MRILPKFHSFLYISNAENWILQPFKSQRMHVSIHRKSPTTHPSKEIPVSEETHMKKPETETKDTTSLFHTISEIVGTENLGIDRNSSEIPIFEETRVRIPKIRPQHVINTLPVCGNTQESMGHAKDLRDQKNCRSDGFISEMSISRKSQLRNQKKRRRHVGTPPVNEKIKETTRTENNVGNMRKHLFEGSICGTSVSENKIGSQSVGIPSVCGNDAGQKKNPPSEEIVCESSVSDATHLGNQLVEDISPVVHRITEIVRAENPQIPMEKCLEDSSLYLNSEIVEKVLKRCFKVGHLALRFFNWVKLQHGFCHTTETYNTMIYIAGEARDFDLMEKLVEEMCMESCPKNINTWTILISHYGKAKMIGNALSAFEKMRKSSCEPDEAAYKSIINALCNVGKAELAMEFYKEMVSKNLSIDRKLCSILMCCLTGAGDIEAIRTVGDDMMKIAEIPENEVYTCILRSFCLSGRMNEALQWIDELKDKSPMPEPENLKVLVKGLCRAGRVDDALEIINATGHNSVGDGKVYEAIVNGYLRKDDFSKAFEVLSTLKESGFLPTVSTYTDMIQHLFHSNEYEKACEIYRQMLGNGIEPDAVAITAMVAGHVQNGRISEAWEAFDCMKRKGIGPTRKAYSVFIKELCKASKTEEAFSLLNEMWDLKINASHKVFHLVSSSLQQKGELEKAGRVKRMFRSFELNNQDDKLEDLSIDHHHSCNGTHNVFSTLPEKPYYSVKQDLDFNQVQPARTDISVMDPSKKGCSCHDLDEVCRILSSSKDWWAMQEVLERSTVHFTPELALEILHNCQKHGYAALQFFSWVGQRSGYKHTSETYNMAIKISGGAKDFKHMRKLHLEMRRKECLATSDTWTIMITQYGRAGLTEIALKKFEEMKVEGCKPNGSTYKYLIIFLCGKKGRKVDEAVKMFQEMTCVGHVPDKELCEIYLSCLCEVGRLLDARRCFESLCNSGFAIQTSYSLLVKALCRAGRLEEALALEGTQGLTVDRYIYGSLIHGLLRGGRLDEALEKIDAMKRGGIVPTVHVYTSLIVHFFKEKQIGKALEMFNQMVEDSCEPTVITYSALIRGYAMEGRISEAWNVFRRMKLKGPFPDFRTYSMFVTCLCRIGRSEEALQLIHEMLDSGILPSSINFRTVFYGLNREGPPEKATVASRNFLRICVEANMGSRRKLMLEIPNPCRCWKDNLLPYSLPGRCGRISSLRTIGPMDDGKLDLLLEMFTEVVFPFDQIPFQSN